MISRVGSPEKSLCPSRGIKESHLLDQLFTWGKLGSKPIHPLPSPRPQSRASQYLRLQFAFCTAQFSLGFYFRQRTGTTLGDLPTKHRPPIPNGLPFGGKGTPAQLGKLLNPPVRLSRAKRDARTQNGAAQDRVSQKGLMELNQALCSRTIWAWFVSKHR